ncbi:MAG: outer membrane protein transport protein [Kofleriaceae bacterium]
MLAAASTAHAGGLYLPGNGPVSVARAGAAVVSLDDPSAIGVNPAALAGTEGTVAYVGSSLVSFNLTFGRYGSYEADPVHPQPWDGQPYGAVSDTSKPAIGVGPYQAVPVIGIASNLRGKLKGVVIAAGVYAPTAYPSRKLGADYTFEDPTVPPPPTRYDVVEQKAAVVLPSIAVAYRPTAKLDLGARFSAGLGDIEATTYTWGLSNFTEWVGNDSRFHVKVKDNFIPAFGLGAKYRITPAIEVAAAWSSAVPVRAKGTGDAVAGSGAMLNMRLPEVIPVDDAMARCAKGGAKGAIAACVNFDLPQTVALGGRYVVRDAGGAEVADVELDVNWEQWSAATNQDVIVDGDLSYDGTTSTFQIQPSTIKHNFKDVVSVRLGGSYQRDLGPGRVTLRGGAAYDTTTARDGWQRVDLDGAARTTLAAGASLGLKKVRIDVGGGYVYEGTRTQGVGCNPPRANTGCDGGAPLPPGQRTGPDPIQPLAEAGSQQQSPFNEGAIKSGYTLLMVGVSTWF